MILRARKAKHRHSYFVERVKSCVEIKPFSKRGFDFVQLLVAHGQTSENLAIFLYSILDVAVGHAFLVNIAGDAVNMKNFQRFDNRAESESVTVLNTQLRTMDAVGFDRLRVLILVDCGLSRLSLDGLDCLEQLDVRENRLDALPDAVRGCRRLRSLRVAGNHIRRLPAAIGELSALTAFDCSRNRLRRLTPHIVNCADLRSLEVDHNDLVELPLDIGLLSKLEELRANRFACFFAVNVITIKFCNFV